MIDWNEQHLMIRDMMRRFVDSEIIPHHRELEHGDRPPYDIMRKLVSSFGIAEAARMRYESMKRRAEEPAKAASSDSEGGGGVDGVAMQLIPIIELSRYCPGMV